MTIQPLSPPSTWPSLPGSSLATLEVPATFLTPMLIHLSLPGEAALSVAHPVKLLQRGCPDTMCLR